MASRSNRPAARGGPRPAGRSSPARGKTRLPLSMALRRLLSGYGHDLDGLEGQGGGPNQEITVLARVWLKGVSYVLCRSRQCFSMLSPREKQVTLLIMNGLGNKEVATRLKISTRTVQGHLQRIYSRLSVDSRSGLFRSCFLETLI